MLTLSDIHERINRVSSRLDELADEIIEAGKDAAITETTFKVEFAKCRLKARAEAEGRKITVDEVEDKATVQTEDARRSYLLATNNLTVLREVLRTLQSQLDGLRTQATSVRAAVG